MCHLNLLSLVLNLLSEGCQPQILVRMSRDSVTMLLIDIGKLLLEFLVISSDILETFMLGS